MIEPQVPPHSGSQHIITIATYMSVFWHRGGGIAAVKAAYMYMTMPLGRRYCHIAIVKTTCIIITDVCFIYSYLFQ